MDLNDNKPFIWRKKYEKKGIKITDKEIEAETLKRIEENKIELEKIRERQRKRDLEYQQKLNDSEFLQRQKELEHHEYWEQQEEDFILRQHRLRSKIRIRDGRAKPIDFLAYYIDVFGSKFDTDKMKSVCLQELEVDLSDTSIEVTNPCEWFDGLLEADLKSLELDIMTYMKADCEGNLQFWSDLLDIAKFEQSKFHRDDSDETIQADLATLLEGKKIQELNDMESEMINALKSDDPSIDTAFYENALLRLRSHRARLRVTQNHKRNLIDYKPKISEKKEVKSLDEVKQATMTGEEKAFMDAAQSGMSNDELAFNSETVVRESDNRAPHYSWSDRYQPRKPRYFNRVHTGFEWNKYNQTHYDIDNPPPKVVQGYKFNLFYPDLIDKSKAPTFTVTPCKDDKDFCIIRFSAGPPYEDIAFRIVNREWNSSHKSGYRCQFTNNMLQLWFQFKRYRYRR